MWACRLSKQSRAAVQKYSEWYAQGPHICRQCKHHAREIHSDVEETPRPQVNRKDEEATRPQQPLSLTGHAQLLPQQLHPSVISINLTCGQVTFQGLQELAKAVKVSLM